MAAAAVASVWTLWPKGIQVSGWSPHLFSNDLAKGMKRIHAEMIALNQAKILENAQCGGELTRRARLSMFLLAVSPLIGGIAGGLSAGTLASVPVAVFLFYCALVFLAAVMRGIFR